MGDPLIAWKAKATSLLIIEKTEQATELEEEGFVAQDGEEAQGNDKNGHGPGHVEEQTKQHVMVVLLEVLLGMK